MFLLLFRETRSTPSIPGKLNPQPFGMQVYTPTNWATWPGLVYQLDVSAKILVVSLFVFIKLPTKGSFFLLK